MTTSEEFTWIPLPPLMGEVKDIAIEELHRGLADQGFEAIRPAHGCVFRFIDSEGSRLTDLAERAYLTKQAVGQAADDLERLGYVDRIPDPLDRRAKIIRLTPRGREAREAAVAIFREIEERWAERFGAGRVAEFRELLEDIVASERAPALPPRVG